VASFYCKSGAGAADYNAAHTYALGDKIVPTVADATTNNAVAKRWVWECTTAGTTNAAPSWPASVTQDVTTFTVNGTVFTARKPGFSSGTTANWAYATPYLQYACSAASVGDTVYVSNNHAETQTAAYTISMSQSQVILCVSDAATPPTALATTAAVTTTGNSTLTISGAAGRAYVYGITFTAASGASGTANVSPGQAIYDSCNFISGTSGTGNINCGSVLLVNCGFKVSAAASTIQAGASVHFRGGRILSGSTAQTNLMSSSVSGTALNNTVLVDGLDLTNMSASANLMNSTGGGFFRNCKFPSAWSGGVNISSGMILEATTIVTNSDSSGTNYRTILQSAHGLLTTQTGTLVRSGGASDGTTAMSWKIVTNANPVLPVRVFTTPEIVKWNAVTGSPVTVTVDLLHDSVTGLKDNEAWIEVEYLGTAGGPVSSLISSGAGNIAGSVMCDPLASGSTLTASSETWNTTGMANPNRQKLAVTFTPQLAGIFHVVVKVAKASKTLYVCPKLTVT